MDVAEFEVNQRRGVAGSSFVWHAIQHHLAFSFNNQMF
jgi:hypothetical protein